MALYQPILHLDTHLPGQGLPTTTDFFHVHWNYWWARHALTTPGLAVFETDYVMAPFTSNLAYNTLSLFWLPLWALIEPLAGTVAAMTAIFLVAMALSGYCFYLLLRREGVLTGLALAGGAWLMLSPLMFVGVFWTNPNLMGWFWPPVLILLWEAILGATIQGRTGRALAGTPVLGAALWGMALHDLQYPVLVGWIVVPYGAATLWKTRAHADRLLGYVALAVALALALFWIAGPLRYILEYDRSTLVSTPVERVVSVPFPDGYLGHVDEWGVRASLGWLLLPSVAVALGLGVWRRPAQLRDQSRSCAARRWGWLALAVPPLVLAAGGAVTLVGAKIPLPYRALHALLGGMFRYPERFAPVALVPAAIFVLMTLSSVLARRPVARRVVPVGLLLLVLLDARWGQPFPIQPQPTGYDFYAALGREPYEYVVVEVPTGASSGEGLVGEPVYATTQFYGLTHGKRMINGHLSRVDPAHFWYLRMDDPLLSWLGQRRLLEPERAEARLRAIIPGYPVGYLVVHTDWIDRYTGRSTTQEVLGWLNSLPDLLCPVFEEGAAVVYRTVWHPDGCPPRTPPEIAPGVFRLDVGTAGDAGFLGWGWHWAEEIVPGLTARWTGQLPQTEVYVELPPGDYTLTLAAQSFERARELRILAGDVLLGAVTVAADGLAEYTFDLPAAHTGGFLALTLAYDAPQPAGDGADRPLALLVDWLRFERR